jgi:hypothetical protein
MALLDWEVAFLAALHLCILVSSWSLRCVRRNDIIFVCGSDGCGEQAVMHWILGIRLCTESRARQNSNVF